MKSLYNEVMVERSDKKKFSPSIGIGVDVVDIGRFDKMSRRADRLFLNRFFTKLELDYCFARPRPGQHLAARFAAKEAVVKALASLSFSVSDWKTIEVRRSRNGLPQLILPKKFNIVSKISMSHDGPVAVAFALLENYE